MDTSLIWTLAFVPIVVILYKTTPELKTPLQLVSTIIARDSTIYMYTQQIQIEKNTDMSL